MEAAIESLAIESKVLDFDQAKVAEVKKLVPPKFVCENIGTLRSSQGPTFIGEDPILIDRVKNLRGYIDGILNNDKALRFIATMPEKTELSEENIKELLGLGEGYEFVAKRLYYTLNKNVDPEVVPQVVGAHFEERGAPKTVSEALANDTTLILNFLDLLYSEGFQKDFFLNNWPNSPPFSEDVAQSISAIKNKWVTNIQKKDTSSQTMQIFDDLFNKFFNIDRSRWSSDGDTLYNTEMGLKSSTFTKYFERRWPYDDGGLSEWSSSAPSGSKGILDYLKKYAISIERGKYLVSLYKITDKLYQQYFPEIYERPTIENLTMEDPDKPWLSRATESCDQANGHWIKENNELGIKSGGLVRNHTSSEISKEHTFHYAGPFARRKVIELITMTHEETHALYETLVRKYRPDGGNYHDTADHALNEGISVLMELLMSDKLIENAQELGFDAYDVEKFKEIKQARLLDLKHYRNGYTEGTYKILHKVYSEAAGRGKERDMHIGLLAVKEFLLSLDPEKTHQVKRDSQEYKNALKSGKKEDWLALLGKNI